MTSLFKLYYVKVQPNVYIPFSFCLVILCKTVIYPITYRSYL